MTFTDRQKKMIEIYNKQGAREGHARYAAIAQEVGLHPRHEAYVRKTIKRYKETKAVVVRRLPCLGTDCDEIVESTGPGHRLCDKCRQRGEYFAPYALSPEFRSASAGRC